MRKKKMGTSFSLHYFFVSSLGHLSSPCVLCLPLAGLGIRCHDGDVRNDRYTLGLVRTIVLYKPFVSPFPTGVYNRARVAFLCPVRSFLAVHLSERGFHRAVASVMPECVM